MTPKLLEDECSVARLPRNRNRNRFMDVLPADRQMPYLVTPDPTDPESNYINSVFVDVCWFFLSGILNERIMQIVTFILKIFSIHSLDANVLWIKIKTLVYTELLEAQCLPRNSNAAAKHCHWFLETGLRLQLHICNHDEWHQWTRSSMWMRFVWTCKVFLTYRIGELLKFMLRCLESHSFHISVLIIFLILNNVYIFFLNIMSWKIIL